VEGRGGAALVELAVAPDGVGGLEHLDVDPAPLELLDHRPRRTELLLRASTEYERLRQLVLDLAEVFDRERVTFLPPPVGDDPAGQDDQVARLLLAVDDDPAEAVVLKPGYAGAPVSTLGRSGSAGCSSRSCSTTGAGGSGRSRSSKRYRSSSSKRSSRRRSLRIHRS
jgi:hypothetical protein